MPSGSGCPECTKWPAAKFTANERIRMLWEDPQLKLYLALQPSKMKMSRGVKNSPHGLTLAPEGRLYMKNLLNTLLNRIKRI